jgi:hypothetical protein
MMAQKYLAMRMISISIKNLEVLIERVDADLRQSGISEPPGGYTSEQLKKYFVDNQIYPPESFFERNLFSNKNPLVTVTYMWPSTPVKHIAALLKRRFEEDSLVYLDIFLNDQRTAVSITVALHNAIIRYLDNIWRYELEIWIPKYVVSGMLNRLATSF